MKRCVRTAYHETMCQDPGLGLQTADQVTYATGLPLDDIPAPSHGLGCSFTA